MKGFTLIELLAVIVILAIILLIAVPAISGVIENAKKESFIISAKNLNKAAELGYADSIINKISGDVTITFTNSVMTKSNPNFNFEYSGKTPENGVIVITSTGEIGVAITDGNYCVIKNPGEGTYTTTKIIGNEPCVPTAPVYPGMYITDADKGYITDTEGDAVLVTLDTTNPYQYGDYVIAYKVVDAEYPNTYYLKYTGTNEETEPGEMYDFTDSYYSTETPNPLMFDTAEKDVYLEEGITSISAYAFYDNKIVNVSLPETLIETFEGSLSYNLLTEVTVPGSVETVGPRMFEMNELTSITLNNGVSIIEYCAFCGNKLVSFTLPTTVVTVEGSAFAANELTSVTLNNGLTTIGSNAFQNNKLTNINIPNTVTTIESNAFAYNTLTSVQIPDSITAISATTFAHNNLTSVQIPNSVTSIEYEAFAYNLIEQGGLTIDNTNGNVFTGTRAFAYNTANRLITITPTYLR